MQMKINTFITRQFFYSILAGASIALLASCAPKGGAPGSDASAGAPSIERGKYLVTAGGCNDCHTPWTMGPQGPSPDMSKMLSGHPATMPITGQAMLQPPWMVAGSMTMTGWSGPWGVSFSANLTPDSATGLGAWSLAIFDSALRTGKHMGGGRPILPPMPWQGLKNLTDDDLASIYQYLHSIPAVSNKVPDPVMPGTTPPPGMNGPPPPPGVAPPPPPLGAPGQPPPGMPSPHGTKKK